MIEMESRSGTVLLARLGLILVCISKFIYPCYHLRKDSSNPKNRRSNPLNGRPVLSEMGFDPRRSRIRGALGPGRG